VSKLIDSGELPADPASATPRLIKLEDVLAYEERQREVRYSALVETAGDDAYGDDEEPATTAADLRRMRADLAERRRAERRD